MTSSYFAWMKTPPQVVAQGDEAGGLGSGDDACSS
jgi:hypothetical protein